MAESLPISGDKRVYNTRSRKRSLETDEKEELPKCVNLEKEEVTSKGEENSVPDCAICLQTCVHPARLPCGHVFCFLCVKGVVHSGWRCAMCRAPIPHDYLDSPQLLVAPKLVGGSENKNISQDDVEEEFQWFYEGRHGWWRYDERANAELEAAYSKSEDRVTLLIAGYLYEVDLIDLVQIRKSEPNRRRRIKRDIITAPSKGVAGLREDPSDLVATFSRMAVSDASTLPTSHSER